MKLSKPISFLFNGNPHLTWRRREALETIFWNVLLAYFFEFHLPSYNEVSTSWSIQTIQISNRCA